MLVFQDVCRRRGLGSRGAAFGGFAMWAEAGLRQSREDHQQTAKELKRSYGMRVQSGEHLERENAAGEARWGLRHRRHRQAVLTLERTCVGGARLRHSVH